MSTVHALDPGPPRRTFLLWGLVIVIATLAAYGPALGAGYVWDDDDYVTNNRLVQSSDGLGRVWVQGETPQYYPVVFSLFWLQHKLWGLAPWGYHLVNVLLHAASALLLWRLLARLRVPGGWLAAGLFALHPMQVESVAWVTELKNVASTCFYLCAALAYLRFDERRFEGAPGRAAPAYALALGAFTLALLSKSVTCSLPAALVLALLFLRRKLTAGRLAGLAPFFVLGFLLALNTAATEVDLVGAEGADFEHGFLERTLIASRALLFYPFKLLVAWPRVFIYPRWSPDAADPVAWGLFALAAALAALAVWSYLRGRRGVPLALAWYAGSVFPSIGYFNVYPHRFSFVADHFAYLGAPALTVLAALALVRLVPASALRPVAGLLLVALGALSALHARDFEDETTLWRATLERNPEAWIAGNNLALLLLQEAEAALTEGDAARARTLAEEAERAAAAAVDARPDHHRALSHRGIAQRLLGRPEEAVETHLAAIALAPHHAEHHWHLALDYVDSGRVDEALNAYQATYERFLAQDASKDRAAARRDRYELKARNYRIDLPVEWGRLLFENQRYRRAAEVFQLVLETEPQHAQARGALASIARAMQARARQLRDAGRTDEATATARRAEELARGLGMTGLADALRAEFLGG